MQSRLGKLIGALALIVMVAALLRVATTRLTEAKADQPTETTAPTNLDQTKTAPASIPQTPSLLGQNPDKVNPSAVSAAQPLPTSENSRAISAEAIRGIERIEEKRDAISDALRQYFNSPTVEEKARFVRDSERVQVIMEHYYQTHPLQPAKWKDLGWALPIDEIGHRLGYVQALFHDAPPASTIIEEDKDGRMRIDWESSVRFGELSWRAFLESRPTKPILMRVLASRPPESRGDSYAAIESGMAVLEVRHPSETGTVNASYNPHDPRMAPLLEQLEAGRWRNVPVTLRLEFPPRATESNAVLVSSVEGRGWLILSQPRS